LWDEIVITGSHPSRCSKQPTVTFAKKSKFSIKLSRVLYWVENGKVFDYREFCFERDSDKCSENLVKVPLHGRPWQKDAKFQNALLMFYLRSEVYSNAARSNDRVWNAWICLKVIFISISKAFKYSPNIQSVYLFA
jgi:hypothetical protein